MKKNPPTQLKVKPPEIQKTFFEIHNENINAKNKHLIKIILRIVRELRHES